MAYRTTVNGVQLFGNNESYPQWLDFIKSCGIAVGEEGQYDGEIADFMAAMDVCERIVLSIETERDETRQKLSQSCRRRDAETEAWLDRHARSLFDLSEIKQEVMDGQGKALATRLFDALYDLTETGYLFIPMALFRACRNDLELDLGNPNRFRAYRLKPGRVIRVHAG